MTKKTDKYKRVRARVVKLDDDLRQQGIETDVMKMTESLDQNPNDEVISALASTGVSVVEEMHRKYEGKLIGIARVRELTGLSNSEIDRQVRSGRFPSPAVSGEGKDRKWYHTTIIAWVDEQTRRQG